MNISIETFISYAQFCRINYYEYKTLQKNPFLMPTSIENPFQMLNSIEIPFRMHNSIEKFISSA